MRKSVKHPTKPEVEATVGVDRAVGVFVVVERKGVITSEYDALRADYGGVPGALRFLARKGFFSVAAVDEAMRWVQHSLAADAEEEEIRSAGTLAEYLYSAAGGP